MERRGSHGVSGGADDGSSGGGASGGGDDKNKGSDSSHGVNESEGEEFEADTLSGHGSVHMYSEPEDSYSDESAMDEDLSDSDSESEGATSGPLTSPRGVKDSGSNRKEKGHISYSDDFSYLTVYRGKRGGGLREK